MVRDGMSYLLRGPKLRLWDSYCILKGEQSGALILYSLDVVT
jgi:hypothetical protein